MALPEYSMRQLLEAGVHFGHQTHRWNPKMAPYIYGRRNQIHVIDIRETVRGLLRAKKYVSQVVSGGSLVLFVSALPHIFIAIMSNFIVFLPLCS